MTIAVQRPHIIWPAHGHPHFFPAASHDGPLPRKGQPNNLSPERGTTARCKRQGGRGALSSPGTQPCVTLVPVSCLMLLSRHFSIPSDFPTELLRCLLTGLGLGGVFWCSQLRQVNEPMQCICWSFWCEWGYEEAEVVTSELHSKGQTNGQTMLHGATI